MVPGYAVCVEHPTVIGTLDGSAAAPAFADLREAVGAHILEADQPLSEALHKDLAIGNTASHPRTVVGDPFSRSNQRPAAFADEALLRLIQSRILVCGRR